MSARSRGKTRTSAILAACAVVVVGALVALATWLGGGDGARDVELAAHDTDHASASMLADLEASDDAALARRDTDSSASRVPLVLLPVPASTSGGAFVRGTLSASDLSPLDAGDVEIVVKSANDVVASSRNLADGSYAAGPLEPGSYRVSFTHKNFAPQVLALDVPRDVPFVTLDVVLVPIAWVVVHARTPERRPLTTTLMSRAEFAYSFEVEFAATDVALDAGSPLSAGTAVGSAVSIVRAPPYANASARIVSEFDRRLGASDGNDIVGRFAHPGPGFHVHAVWDGRVVASAFVSPGATEAELDVAPEWLLATRCKLVARIVDESTGTPLRGARLHVRWERGFESNATSNDAGVVSVPGVPRGAADVRVDHDGHGTWRRTFDVPASGVADLGTIALAASAVLRVRVVDEEGRRMPIGLEVLELTESGTATPQSIDAAWQEEVAEVRLAERRYVVRARIGANERVRVQSFSSAGRGEDAQLRAFEAAIASIRERSLQVAPTVVDLAVPAERELVLVARSAQLCSFVLENGAGATLRITTAAGLPVAELRGPWDDGVLVRIARGAYTASTTLSNGEHVVQDFTIGSGTNEVHIGASCRTASSETKTTR